MLRAPARPCDLSETSKLRRGTPRLGETQKTQPAPAAPAFAELKVNNREEAKCRGTAGRVGFETAIDTSSTRLLSKHDKLTR